MPCYYPIDAYWAKEANPDTGRTPIKFSRHGSSGDHLQVPCGKCVGCRSDQAQSWAIRIHCEALMHEQNAFLTLTYADNHPVTGEPRPETVLKEHLQDFFKRLRHVYKFRYFATGEYGDQTGRPHYHAIIFGQDFLARSRPLGDGELYTNDVVSRAWGHGEVMIGSVTMSNACYVAGYVQKKIGDETWSLKSTKPGLGKEWLDNYYDDVKRNGFIVVEGKPLPVPPRFLVWYEKELEEVIKQRRERFKNQTPDEMWNKRVRMSHREKNRKSQLGMRSTKI